jgi:hypothetical protein
MFCGLETYWSAITTSRAYQSSVEALSWTFTTTKSIAFQYIALPTISITIGITRPLPETRPRYVSRRVRQVWLSHKMSTIREHALPYIKALLNIIHKYVYNLKIKRPKVKRNQRRRGTRFKPDKPPIPKSNARLKETKTNNPTKFPTPEPSHYTDTPERTAFNATNRTEPRTFKFNTNSFKL